MGGRVDGLVDGLVVDGWMERGREEEGEMEGEDGVLRIFRGASCFFPPTPPALPIGKAPVATPQSRLRFSRVGAAADRREVGASWHWGSPLQGSKRSRRGCARRGAVASFPRSSPASLSPELSPLLPQPPTRDGAMCSVESPRWERYCDATFQGVSAQSWRGVAGRGGSSR